MATGIVPYMNGVALSTGTPVLLSAFIAWGDFRGVLLQAVLIAISTLIYYPFFKMCDRQSLEEEKASAEDAQKA